MINLQWVNYSDLKLNAILSEWFFGHGELETTHFSETVGSVTAWLCPRRTAPDLRDLESRYSCAGPEGQTWEKKTLRGCGIIATMRRQVFKEWVPLAKYYLRAWKKKVFLAKILLL